MHPINRIIVEKFAHVFCGDKQGFSAKEITEYFVQYSNYVRPIEHYGIKPKRTELFIESVYALKPKEQYYALNELAFNTRSSRYPYPDIVIRQGLLEQLHCCISNDPIGLRISKLSETAFREDWATAISRLENEPGAAITSARTMLETVFKTIISERGFLPDTSGELHKLLKQIEEVLEVNGANYQQEHEILKGLISIVNGISTISNKAGDRHGTVLGCGIDDPYIGGLILNSAGVLSILFIELHLFKPINSSC